MSSAQPLDVPLDPNLIDSDYLQPGPSALASSERKRVLVLGMAPLSFENERISPAAGVRTWQFTLPLLDRGHEVLLACQRMQKIYERKLPPVARFLAGERFTYLNIAEAAYKNPVVLQGLLEEYRPDCIVGAHAYGSYAAVLLRTSLPIWCDINGHLMAEAQAKAHVYRDDQYLQYFWDHEFRILDRADKISTVSEGQRLAVIGELGARGRLNYANAGFDLVQLIRNGIDPGELEHKKNVIRGSVVPEDAFVVLWSGGFNTWTDVHLLFRSLSAAMDTDDSIHFVSTGGELKGHDEKTYPQFQELIRESKHRDRFHLMGWVAKEEVASYYFEADVGVNVDRFLYEGLLGCKNRIIDWMRAGLPAVAGELCELTAILKDAELGFFHPLGDERKMTELFVSLAGRRNELPSLREKIRRFASQEFSYEKIMRPYLEWVEQPVRAPDEGKRMKLKELPIDPEERIFETEVMHIIRLYGKIRPLAEKLGLIALYRFFAKLFGAA